MRIYKYVQVKYNRRPTCVSDNPTITAIGKLARKRRAFGSRRPPFARASVFTFSNSLSLYLSLFLIICLSIQLSPYITLALSISTCLFPYLSLSLQLFPHLSPLALSLYLALSRSESEDPSRLSEFVNNPSLLISKSVQHAPPAQFTIVYPYPSTPKPFSMTCGVHCTTYIVHCTTYNYSTKPSHQACFYPPLVHPSLSLFTRIPFHPTHHSPAHPHTRTLWRTQKHSSTSSRSL